MGAYQVSFLPQRRFLQFSSLVIKHPVKAVTFWNTLWGSSASIFAFVVGFSGAINSQRVINSNPETRQIEENKQDDSHNAFSRGNKIAWKLLERKKLTLYCRTESFFHW